MTTKLKQATITAEKHIADGEPTEADLAAIKLTCATAPMTSYTEPLSIEIAKQLQKNLDRTLREANNHSLGLTQQPPDDYKPRGPSV